MMWFSPWNFLSNVDHLFFILWSVFFHAIISSEIGEYATSTFFDMQCNKKSRIRKQIFQPAILSSYCFCISNGPVLPGYLNGTNHPPMNDSDYTICIFSCQFAMQNLYCHLNLAVTVHTLRFAKHVSSSYNWAPNSSSSFITASLFAS